MDANEARTLVVSGGLEVKGEERLANGTGTQLRLTNGAVINLFDNSTVSVQGKNREAVNAILFKEPLDKSGGKSSAASRISDHPNQRKVFVVYGHDQTSRTQLEAMIRRWGLEPLILDQLPTEGQTIIEKLEGALAEAKFGIILVTPDDEGFRVGHPDEKAFRARQNVVLEMGTLLTKLGRKNVAILLKTQEKMERPSDIQGLIYIPFKEDIAKEAGLTVAQAMVASGYEINIMKL